MNGGSSPEVVCRNDVSLPVRTAWLHAWCGQRQRPIVLALNRRIVRLGKLRVWLQSPSLAPGVAGWPYHLAVTEPGSDKAVSGLLHPDQNYDIRLLTTADQRAATTLIPNVYLSLWLRLRGQSVSAVPGKGPDRRRTASAARRRWRLSSLLSITQEQVGTPLGADTLFLLATGKSSTDPDASSQQTACWSAAPVARRTGLTN